MWGWGMTEFLWILVIALVLDRALGEPPNTFHPTAYLGRGIAFLSRKLGDRRLHGAALYLAVAPPFAGVVYLLASLAMPLGFFLSAALLKLQFSWRGLRDHAHPVALFLEKGELDKAREAVAYLVGRDTASLGERHVASAAVESVGESSVDGIIAPMFYYLVFGAAFGAPLGVAAAALYRATNTLDSMVGYKKEGLGNLGLCSARMDDLLNYLPARLGAALLIASSLLIGRDYRNALAVYLRDRGKTPSPNSGHPIAALAGALGVQLEKIGYYKIGDNHEELGARHVRRALGLVNCSVLIFILGAMLWQAL